MFPPRVVLAATDFSDSSRAALTYAARFATQCGAQLHVLHAQDPLLAGAARQSGIDLTAETRTELETLTREVLGAGTPAPTCHVVTGPAMEVIRDIAQREGADVIVIAAHGMSGAERRVFGSTTEGVLRGADVSVVVVPDSWTPPSPDGSDLRGTGPIVAGVDHSLHALAAARAACQLAELLGTSVEAVHVVPALPVLARWSKHAEEAVRQRVESAHAELTAALKLVGDTARVTLRVETGKVAECLGEQVDKAAGPHPMLVLGRRPHKDRSGAPGSTAYRVLSTTRVPVLMYLPED